MQFPKNELVSLVQMYTFTKQELQIVIVEILESYKTTPNQIKQIENSVWREISIKQSIKPFDNEQSAILRVKHLATWFYKEFSGRHE